MTSFVLFLLLLGATHVQDTIDLVSADLEQLEENNWSLELSMYLVNNEKKMVTGQQLASCAYQKKIWFWKFSLDTLKASFLLRVSFKSFIFSDDGFSLLWIGHNQYSLHLLLVAAVRSNSKFSTVSASVDFNSTS